jgi:Xaa-Pro aminopeptidase
VEASLLTPDERDWLNAYHARVRQSLSRHLDSETRAWLEHATRAI